MSASLEIDQDLQLARSFWRIQRIGWVVMSILVISALFGVFGTGMLATATASSGALEVTYDKFGRYTAPLTYEIKLKEGHTSVKISNEIISEIEISAMVPEPASVYRNEAETIFTFDSSDGVLPLTIHGTWQTLGSISGTITAEADVITVNHFIYP